MHTGCAHWLHPNVALRQRCSAHGMGKDQALVLDNGGGHIKLGFSGEAQPRIVFPNCTAKPKGERNVLVGEALLAARDLTGLSLRRPIDRGYVVNPDLQKDIWARALRSQLVAVAKPGTDVRGLVLTEPLFNFKEVQAVMEEIVFEEFGFKSFFVAPAPWFALQRACNEPQAAAAAAHRGTAYSAALAAQAGVVIDAGFSHVHVVPFFEGRLLSEGVRRLSLGGKALSNLLKELVSYRSLNMMEEGLLLMDAIKEAVCFVSADALADLAVAQSRASPHRLEYLLPDGVHNLTGYVRRPGEGFQLASYAAAGGEQQQQQQQRTQQPQADASSSSKPAPGVPQQVLLLNNERFMVPEALFRPSEIGLQQAGLAECVMQAVEAVHPTLAPLLYAHVLLTGGCTQLPGFRERLEAELRPLVPDEYELHVVLPSAPQLYAWEGASMFGASPAYAAAASTKAAYDASGGSAARRARQPQPMYIEKSDEDSSEHDSDEDY